MPHAVGRSHEQPSLSTDPSSMAQRGPAPGHPPLRRSSTERVLTGLCGGIATFTGARPGTVRLLFIAGTLVTLGTVAVGYLALSVLIPAAD